MGIIDIKNLNKSFGGSQIYKNLNFSIENGEVVSIIGASGCGKSVLLRCIEMLEKPDSGQIFIDGKEITSKGADIASIRRLMGMVYQDFGLFSNMNVMQNLCIAPMKLLKMPKEEAEKKALELLDSVGLADRAYRPVQVLSGGQKQRVAICRCMMMNPKIILFDEPTSALDPTMVGEVLATIRMLARKGLTMLIVTHEMEFAKQIADRVVFLAEGGIYEQGTPEQIFENPQKPKTVDFIKKLKHLSYSIDSRKFDLMALQGGIQEFAIKYGLNSKEAYRLQICVEEMIYIILEHLEDGKIDITLNISFSEADRSCEFELLYPGDEIDPFANAAEFDLENTDSLGLMIITKKAKKREYSFENGINKVKIKI
ncbi:MAG: amino acid ABC transporter ATP-binding protein [Clostridia bacterium]|nr:amino acid ABC transporter ATP-binding protein [Clostridia bacterium]